MKAIINFSKPELFLIGILVGGVKKRKNKFLINLRQYIPGRDRIPGNCTKKFLSDVYNGLKNLGLINELDDDIVLTERGNFVYSFFREKAQLFKYDMNDILRDILHFYNKKIFDDGPGVINMGELLILEQSLLISNPIINFLINILQLLSLQVKDLIIFFS